MSKQVQESINDVLGFTTEHTEDGSRIHIISKYGYLGSLVYKDGEEEQFNNDLICLRGGVTKMLGDALKSESDYFKSLPKIYTF
jgi:hypothetical protein